MIATFIVCILFALAFFAIIIAWQNAEDRKAMEEGRRQVEAFKAYCDSINEMQDEYVEMMMDRIRKIQEDK